MVPSRSWVAARLLQVVARLAGGASVFCGAFGELGVADWAESSDRNWLVTSAEAMS